MEDYKKKYEEALEKAKSMMALPDDKAMIEEIFPELKESEESENERIRKDIVFYIAANHKDDGEKARWLYWLEKKCEQKPDWSEEDLYKIENALFGTYAVDVATRLLNKIKSIKPQNTWKPSEKQIMSLYNSIPNVAFCERETLTQLYVDLKKLKE